MDNRKQDSFDQRFLAPLKNRPGLEPDQSFIEKLRTEISQESKINNMSIKPKWRLPVLVPIAMAVLLFSVLTASFVGTNSSMEKTPAIEKAEIIQKEKDDVLEENEERRDLYKLNASNPAYESAYRKITKVTGAPSAGKELVYYFDALEKGDKQFLSNTLEFEYASNSHEEMIKYYETADFTTLEIENMIPAENNRLQVIFSYMDTKKNKTTRRSLLIDMSDQKNYQIIDSVTFAPLNNKKDELVKEKVELIEKNFKLGMSEQEAVRIFGTEFKDFVNSDAEDGSVKEWLYEFYKDEDTVSTVDQVHVVDVINLRDQKIGMQFSIGWSADNRAIRMAMFYAINGKIYIKGIKPNGEKIEEEQVTGEIVIDSSPFYLTEQEQEAYNWFKLEHDKENLKELSPISIAKIYVQAGVDRDAETEYALYTTRPDRIMWSWQEHKEYSSNEDSTKEEVPAAFQGLQNGEFVQTSDIEGHIKFENSNGSQGFSMIRDPDGIWKVAFMPIQ